MRSVVRTLGLASVSAGGVAVAVVVQPGLGIVAMAVLVVVAHLVTVPSPSGRRNSLFPLVGTVMVLVTGGSLAVVLGGAAIGLPIAWLAVHLLHGRRVTDHLFPADPLGLVVSTVVVWTMATVVGYDTGTADALTLTFTAIASAGWFVVATVVRALMPSGEGFRLSLSRAIWDWPGYVSMFAAAALYGATENALGWWAVPLTGLPYAFSHVSLSRLQRTRHTYRQTIRALGRVPEAGGIVAGGHSQRCADLAVAVGSELGLTGRALERLEYAALLHDLGRVVLTNPAIASGDYSERDVAGWSAAIIAEARYLEPVSEIVAGQHRPYRRPGMERDEQVAPGSQVVRVVARYDAATEGGLGPVDALEVLYRGAAYDYDPNVVAALRSVLERRGTVAA